MKLPGPIHSCLLALLAFALLFSPMSGPASAAGIHDKEADTRPWSFSLQTRYFFKSHTSVSGRDKLSQKWSSGIEPL
jgi:hypothetical protein